MGQALYRKYRSKNLSEVVGQEHITRTLQRAIKNNTISHAYLFTGPRGVGKTSVARILAHEINNLPYTDESAHLDIIEIDAASNRRIDEIRDLRDKVHIAPAHATYKVYIIDEVHMLTREAFNALLKTLEEPPAHVVFILATTELHKLPETIISRTQRFTFKSIDNTTAAAHLKNIAKSEKIKIDDEALQLLAEHGKGSFRDSISLLDQVGHSADAIHADDVGALIGLASREHIERVFTAITKGNTGTLIASLNDCVADGVNPAQIAKQLSEYIRNHLVSELSTDASTLINLLGELIQVPSSSEPAAALEVALFRAQLALQPVTPPREALATAPSLPAQAKPVEPMQKKKPAEKSPPVLDQTPPKPAAEESERPVKGEIADWWNEVLDYIKTINNTLYGVLRMAEPRVDEDTLHLSFGFGFHKRKVANAETQAKIHEAITKVTGTSYRINPVYDSKLANTAKSDTPVATSEEPAQTASNDLSSIASVFGGAEVLES